MQAKLRAAYRSSPEGGVRTSSLVRLSRRGCFYGIPVSTCMKTCRRNEPAASNNRQNPTSPGLDECTHRSSALNILGVIIRNQLMMCAIEDRLIAQIPRDVSLERVADLLNIPGRLKCLLDHFRPATTKMDRLGKEQIRRLNWLKDLKLTFLSESSVTEVSSERGQKKLMPIAATCHDMRHISRRPILVSIRASIAKNTARSSSREP